MYTEFTNRTSIMYTITQPVPVMEDKVFWQKPKIRETEPVRRTVH